MFKPIQLINVGAHIGSSKQCWSTLTSRFVSGFRKGITFINVGYTSFHLRRALIFVKKTTSKGGIIMINSLYVNTHIDIINRFYNLGQIVAPGDWIGGYLSNYRNLKDKVISKRRSRSFVSALINLNYNIDNRFISSEARNLRLPIVSIFDTNSQCSMFDYPIPTNNKNSSIRTFYAFLFSSSVFWGIARKVLSTKKRSKISLLKNKFNRYTNNNLLTFNNSNYFTKNNRINQIKTKYIYFRINDIKRNRQIISPFMSFSSNFFFNKTRLFNIFKKRFLYSDIVSNFDIMGLFISKALETIMYRIFKINSINRINFKNRMKVKLMLKKPIFSKIYFARRDFPFIMLKRLKNISVHSTFNNFYGSVAFDRFNNFSSPKRSILFFFNKFFSKFVFQNHKETPCSYPWRKNFRYIKKVSKIFRSFILSHRRNFIRRVYFCMRKDSRYMVGKSKIVKIYRFSKRKARLNKKNFTNFSKKRDFRKKFVKENVGRWNRTATVSFSGLYSTIELSRLFRNPFSFLFYCNTCLDTDQNFPFLNVTEKFLLILYF